MYKTSQIWLGFNTSQQGIIYLFSGCGIRSDDTYREMGGLLVHQREELEATRFLCTACFASHAERNVMRIIPSLSPYPKFAGAFCRRCFKADGHNSSAQDFKDVGHHVHILGVILSSIHFLIVIGIVSKTLVRGALT
jgi:hypothetical protein